MGRACADSYIVTWPLRPLSDSAYNVGSLAVT